MKIIDKREKWIAIPAVEILNKSIPIFRKENLLGIRRIILKDVFYDHKKRMARGRYCPIASTNRADIEIYFEWYDEFPPELKKNDIYLHYMIIRIFLHEVYHHIVRGQKRIKKMKNSIEEENCFKWAHGGAQYALQKMFPPEEYKSKLTEIKDFWSKESGPVGKRTRVYNPSEF